MKIEFVSDDGVTLAASLAGPDSAPAVLLLHSLGCNSAMWGPQIAALQQQFRVIALDMRGHGASGAPDGAYRLERLSLDALALLDHLGIPSTHICGISLGGMIGQQLAIIAPHRVGRLVLANTAARIGTAQSWQDRENTVRAQGLAAIADIVLGRFFSPAFHAAHPHIVASFRATLLATPSQGYAGCCAALRVADLTEKIGNISSPTLVIAGEGDLSTPPDQARALAAGIPQAELLLLDATHLSSVEQPDVFSAALLKHFAY